MHNSTFYLHFNTYNKNKWNIKYLLYISEILIDYKNI